MACALAPAEPKRLVRALVVSAAKHKAVFRPDDRVGPVTALLGKDAAHQRQLLAAHAAIDCTVNRAEEQLRPGPDESLPGRRVERVVRDRATAGAGLVTAVVAVVDVVGRIGEGHRRLRTHEGAGYILGVRGIAAEEAVPAEMPHVAGLGQRPPGRLPECHLEVERLGALAPLLDLRAAEEVRELILAEPRDAEVDPRHVLEIGEQTRQERFIPLTAGPVQGQPEKLPPLGADIEPGDRDELHTEATGSEQALVAADHDSIQSACEQGLDEAELADAARQRVELWPADVARVRGVGFEQVDRNLLDDEGLGG